MRPVITRVLCLTAPGTALALLGLTGAAAPAGATGVAGTTRPPVTVYVSSSLSGTVTPIRTATNRAGRAIKTGASPSGISGVAITPNGRTLYLCDRDGLDAGQAATSSDGWAMTSTRAPLRMTVIASGRPIASSNISRCRSWAFSTG
jgi:YVTN family beta-propeller protein